jgi:hypothetical protein
MAYRIARDNDQEMIKQLVKSLAAKGLSSTDIAEIVEMLGADPTPVGKPGKPPAMDSATVRSLAKRYPHASKIRNLDKEGNL